MWRCMKSADLRRLLLVQLLSPEETSLVHGIDQGAGLVDRDLIGVGGSMSGCHREPRGLGSARV